MQLVGADVLSTIRASHDFIILIKPAPHEEVDVSVKSPSGDTFGLVQVDLRRSFKKEIIRKERDSTEG